MAGNQHCGSTLDSVLEEKGILAELQAKAIKEVIAWQPADAMRESKLSKDRLAAMMYPSRSQVDRVLNPADGNATIETARVRQAVSALLNYPRY